MGYTLDTESIGAGINWTEDIQLWLKIIQDPEKMANFSFFMNESNSSQFQDMYRHDLFKYGVMGIGATVVCCLGIIGNILSLIVLSRRSMRSSTYSYLSALSVCDTLVLLFTLILVVHDLEKPKKGSAMAWDRGLYPYLFPIVHPLAMTFQVTSVWLTLAFTVDRYIMICHPFKAEPYCSVSRARKVICALYIGGTLFSIPKFLEYQTIPVTFPSNGSMIVIGHSFDLTEVGKSSIFRELYHSWFYMIFVCGVPFLTIAVLNAFLMNAVRLSRKRGREINLAEKKRNDTTVMLIGVIVIFFISQMPALVSRTIWAFESQPDIAFRRFELYALNEIGSFLIVLNSAINIVPYYLFGKRFRHEFWRLFCHCLQGYEKFQFLTRKFSTTIDDRNSIGSQKFPMVLRANAELVACTNGTAPRGSQVHFLQVRHDLEHVPVVNIISDESRKTSLTSNNNEGSVSAAKDDSSMGRSVSDGNQEVESLL